MLTLSAKIHRGRVRYSTLDTKNIYKQLEIIIIVIQDTQTTY
jgi:hypothetical protein